MIETSYSIFYLSSALGKLSLVLAILFAIVSILLFKNTPKLSLILLTLGGFFVAIFFSLLDPFLNVWDEQYHTLVAKHLSETPLHPRLFPFSPLPQDYSNWVENTTWLHKPPITLWQMALSIKIFGANYFSIRLPSIIMHTLLIPLIYRVGNILYSSSVGFYSALVFAFFHFPLELVSGVYTADHIDVAFMFYIMVSIWMYVEFDISKNYKWLYFMGAFCGLAILTKWLVGMLCFTGVIMVYLLTKTKTRFELKKIIVALTITFSIVIPWHVFAYISYPLEYSYEMRFNSRHFFEVIEFHGGDALYYLFNLNKLYGNGDLIIALIVTSIAAIPYVFERYSLKIFLITIVLTPIIFFSLASTKMISFLAILIPIIIILLVALIHFSLKKLHFFHFLDYQLVRVFMALVVIFSVLRLKEVEVNHFNEIELRSQRININKHIKAFKIDETVKTILLSENTIEQEHILWMIYHDNLVAYNRKLSNLDKEKLRDQGYKVYDVSYTANGFELRN